MVGHSHNDHCGKLVNPQGVSVVRIPNARFRFRGKCPDFLLIVDFVDVRQVQYDEQVSGINDLVSIPKLFTTSNKKAR